MKNRISMIIVLLGLCSAPVLSQEVMTPMDVAKLKYVSSIQTSPDGQWVAYSLVVPADPLKENKPASIRLFLLNTKTGESRPFVTQGSVSSVSFRPSYRTITFIARREGDNASSLYEISLEGGEAQKIYNTNTSISSYHWSPDGEKLLYIASEEKVEPKAAVSLPYEPEIYEEDLTFRKAFIYDMTSNELTEVNLEGHFSFAEWSPDGARLAVVTAPTPLVDDSYMDQRITVLEAEGFKVVGVVDHSAKLGEIKWSPDNKYLAFLAGEDIHDPTPGRLLVAPVTGGTAKNLNASYDGMFEEIEWQDNNTILFLSSRGTMSALGTVRPDGSRFNHLLEPKDIVLNSVGLLPSGGYVFMAESPMHPREVYMMKEGQKAPIRITDSNPWLKDLKMAKQEVVRYEARDGRKIEGILIHPLDEQPGKKYPMITIVHGGPESHYSNGWLTGYSTAGQVGAAKGFAVFYPNYRGSTGRGVEFAKSSQGDLAGKEFDDIVDGVDHLIATGLVDKDKVGVTGGSYGGYATAWLSTYYSDRFAAGVMFVGISNNLSKWGTTDIPEELYLVHSRKRVWEDYDWWLKRSPVYYADQAKTPLLIMHGKNDTRVYPGQSMELYRHIKTRTDTPVRLVYYPGEGHGNRNSTARFDYNLRSMRWFMKYLKNEEVDLETRIDIEGN